MDPDQESFNVWADAQDNTLNCGVYSSQSCGRSTGGFGDYTAHFNCPWEQCHIEVEYSIAKGKFADIQYFYRTFDADGKVMDDSLIMKVDESDENRDYVTFFLGHVADADLESEGVQNNWQRRIGFRTGPGTGEVYQSDLQFKC